MHVKEGEFWSGIAQGLNPNWKIRLGSKWAPGAGGLGESDLYVYAVDVRTGWTCLAAMTTAEANRLIQEANKNEPGMKDGHGFVAEAISEVAVMAPEKIEIEQERLMIATTMAISTTKSFAVAKPGTCGLATHCLYLSYKANDRSYIGRPAIIKSRTQGAVAPSQLLEFVRVIVSADILGVPPTGVSRMIQRCGGVAVAEELR